MLPVAAHDDALFEKDEKEQRRIKGERSAPGVRGSQIAFGSTLNLILGVRSFALSKYTIFVI